MTQPFILAPAEGLDEAQEQLDGVLDFVDGHRFDGPEQIATALAALCVRGLGVSKLVATAYVIGPAAGCGLIVDAPANEQTTRED